MKPDFKTFSKCDNSLLWEGVNTSIDGIDRTVKLAKNTFKEWSKTPLSERFLYLQQFQDKLIANKDSFSKLISEEVGKPFWESKTEIDAMIRKIDISAAAFKTRITPLKKKNGKIALSTFFKPHGVLAVFGPFNFPGHLPNGHIIPALLAGNTIIFKPSEKTPATGEFYKKLWEETDLPKGVFNLIQGGKETGQGLSSHSGLDGLLFTGSFNVGKELSKLYSNTPGKLLALEMGGNNPLVVREIQELNAAVFIIIQSAFITTGQRCSAARRLILPDSEWSDYLIEKLIKAIHKIKIGPPNQIPEPFLGPLISDEAAQNVLKIEQKLIKLNGKSLLPCEIQKTGKSYITPGLIDVTSCNERIDEECFGPLLQIIRVKNFDEAIDEANHTNYGLTAGLISQSNSEWQEFQHRIKAGVLSWNVPMTGASSESSFGGLKNSGNLRPSAFFAVDYCSTPIASSESYTPILPSSTPEWLKD